MDGPFDFSILFSGFSVAMTTYFWFVKARKERPHLEFYQLSDFRTACRRHPEQEGVKRLCIQQIDTGGVLIVNHSSRQNSIALFFCFLKTEQGEIQGDWGYTGDDKPPWNVGPETAIAFSPACFFDVPEDYEVPENPEFRIQFATIYGQQFSHTFQKVAPRTLTEPLPSSRAA